jgi:hypothetical protein
MPGAQPDRAESCDLQRQRDPAPGMRALTND